MDTIEPAISVAHPEFNAAEIGAIAHLYRAEVYRSTIWRTRLDNTTNWAIVTMGIALSTTFSSREASPAPLLLVGLLLALFLAIEARRYRYFNVWRARARWLETNLYAPMLAGAAISPDHASANQASSDQISRDQSWRDRLARDYLTPRHHISFARSVGRRLRRSYVWILVIQTVAWCIKIGVHPVPASGLSEIVDRAALGPLPGWLILTVGAIYNAGWITLAMTSWWRDRQKHGGRKANHSMG